MAGKRSRNKGAGGEREIARILREHGFDAERGARNGKTSEDVEHSIEGIHLEVKRCERLSIDKWVKQAEGDAAEGCIPLVVYRKNNDRWRAIIPLEDLLKILGGNSDATK